MRVAVHLAALVAWLRRPAPRAAAAGMGILLTSAFGVWVYKGYVDPIYPVADWLAWPLLKIWGYCALANLAWFALGSLIVGRLLGLRELPLLETALLNVTVGLVGFTWLMYLAGALGLFGPVFSVALVVVLILTGAPELLVMWRRYEAARDKGPAPGAGVLLLWCVGGALTSIIYLGVLSPDAINYDATWCHLTIAQDYAREGRIVPFPGDYSKNVPHLASIVHTWGFSVPGLPQPALRWMLALHQEFSVFLWTLAGVAAATRRMVQSDTLRGSWALFYLFPIIFVYDHNLGGAADHFAAFFALPGVLAASRLLERLSWQRAAAMVLCMAGGFLTKYQSFYWMSPLLLLLGLKLGRVLWQQRGKPADPELRRALLSTVLVVGVGLPLLVAPHFLKNWLFYRNPVYPFLQQAFTGTHPTVDNGAFLFGNIFTDLNWVPKGTFFEKVRHALRLMFTFSFQPHYSFTKNVPAFGSLFTLLLPTLLFIRQRRAKLLWIFVSLTTLFIWGLTFNVDRNLQVFMPILVATTSGLLVEIWRLGWLARVAVAPLLAFQLLWGGDAYFYSSQERIRQALDLISTGFNGGAKGRFDKYRSAYVAVGKALPRDAKVMMHTAHITLGIDRTMVLDWSGFQGLISYSKVHDERELFQLYQRVGLTHIVYMPGERPASSIQEEIVFQALVPRLGAPVSSAGGFRLLRLPSQAPPAKLSRRVLTLGLYGYGSGVFAIDQLGTNEYLAPAKRQYARAAEPAPSSVEGLEALGVDAVVVGASANLSSAQHSFLRRHFSSVVSYSGQQQLYLRKTLLEGHE